MSTTVVSSIRAKLDAMTEKQKKASLTWKPTRGEEAQIRIVPYLHGSDPFNELYFHYELGETKVVLCPKTSNSIDGECPICEYLQERVVNDRSERGKALYSDLRPKFRAYVPVIVRGQEEQGVRFWGIGKKTYQSIAELFLDPDYGDISDPLKGRDLKVVATKPNSEDRYGRVNIRPAASSSKLHEDSNMGKKIIETCPIVFDAFTKYTYAEMEKILEAYLTPNKVAEPVEENPAEDKPPVQENVANAEGVQSMDEMFDDITSEDEEEKK